ncbi:MAG: glycosyltransferase family 4 protein [Ignisphaera sp.]
MSIRVAFVSKQLSRNPMDGVAVYSANIISELRKLGVTVYEVWPGATFTGKWPIYNLHALKYIVNLLKEKKINIVHGNAADGFLLSSLEGVPYILTVHPVLADEILKTGEFVDSVKRFRLDRLLILKALIEAEHFAAVRSDVIIVPSIYVKQRVIEYYGVPSKKIEVIPHGINIEEFNNINQVLDYNACRKNGVRICFVGRLTRRKGLIYLIKATEILKKKGYQISVNIIGDGPERKNLEKYITKRSLSCIRFMGNLSRRRLLEELFTCDIFCMPSLHEAFGIAILEAMAARKPVVASTVGGIPELVLDGETGFLIPPGDVRGIVEAIEKLIIDEELRLKMGMNAYRRASQFSWKIAAEKLMNLYGRLLKS